MFFMTSKKFGAPLTVALLAAAPMALLALPAHAAAPHLTRAVNNALAKEQKDYAAGDYKAATDDIATARAVDGRTPEDDYWINKLAINVDVKTQNMAQAAQDAEAAADSPAMPAEEKADITRLALVLANNQKQTDKAVAYAKVMQATNPTDPAVLSQITVAYFNAKDFADAQAMVQKSIDADTAAGKKPARDTLQNLLDIQVAQHDEAGAEKTLETLVADYNDPKDWSQMIDVAISSKGIRDVEAIWLGRLAFLVGTTPMPQDLTLIGSTADHLTFYGDAEQALQHGGTGFANDSARAEADKKTIPQQIAAGQKQNGQYNVKLAEALYSYGMYPEAQAAAQLAMTKGGTTDPSEAPMVLGQSLAAQGKYDDAIAAFGKVTGGGPATQRITRLWVDYCNVKKNPPSTTAAAAAPAPAK
jgi:tetratricopeptide (TPR) repeat protein